MLSCKWLAHFARTYSKPPMSLVSRLFPIAFDHMHLKQAKLFVFLFSELLTTKDTR